MKRASILVLGGMLAACGGSGGTSAGSAVVVTPPPPPPPVASTGADSAATFTDQAAARGLALSTAFSDAVVGMPREFAGGAAGGDVDGDGDVDLFVLRGDTQANALYLNNGVGSFTEATPKALALPDGGTANYRLSGPTFADMDGDGALDLFIGGINGDPSLVFAGDGAGGFTDVSATSGLANLTSPHTLSAAFGDYDGDAKPDLALAHWGAPRDADDPGDTETLWRNLSQPGAIAFESDTLEMGLVIDAGSDRGVLGPDHDYSFAPNFADLDNDGDLDLFMVSDFFTTQVFRNDGNGFTDITDRNQITDTNGMGAAVGDVTGDGRLDAFASSINTNRFYRNIDGTLIDDTTKAGVESGGWGWGACMADFDLDGDLDIYQTNGWVNDGGSSPQEPYTSDRTRLWINDGTGAFEDAANSAGLGDTGQGRGVVCADIDGDRDIDVVQMLSASDPGLSLWINAIDTRNAISVLAKGPAGNSAGLGARITVTADGHSQTREIKVGSNFTSHDPVEAIIGLGARGNADVRIVWPDGTSETQSGVQPGERVVFDHADAR